MQLRFNLNDAVLIVTTSRSRVNRQFFFPTIAPKEAAASIAGGIMDRLVEQREGLTHHPPAGVV
jgi:hypothetical protein